MVSGNGGNYGGGGGGLGCQRTAASPATVGSGAGGVIVIVYTSTPLPWAGTGRLISYPYDYVPDREWVGAPQGASTLIIIERSPDPPMIARAPRYAPKPDQQHLGQWTGTPRANPTLMFIPPPVVTRILRAPIYVPRGVDPTFWQSYSDGVNLLLQPLLAPLTNPPWWTGPRVPTPEWVGAPQSSFNLTAPLPPFAAGQTPWNYRVLPPEWVGRPIPSATISPLPPFTVGQQPWDYRVAPAEWVGPPQGSDAIVMLTAGGPPFSNEWASLSAWDSGATGWFWGPQWGPNPALSLTIPKPFPLNKQLWRYDFDVEAPNKWQGTPTYNMVPEQFNRPFAKLWRYDFNMEFPDKWQGTPTSNVVPRQLASPFSNEWANLTAWDSGQTYWQRYSWPAQALEMLVEGGLPFSNEWASQYTYEPDKFWLGTPEPAVSLTIPKPQPLNKQLWRYDYDVEAPTKWQGSPLGSNVINALTAGGAPFFKQWEYHYEPDKFWQGEPVPTNIEFFPFIMPFHKLWRYDLITDTYWVGTPTFNEVPEELVAPFSIEWASQYAWDSDVKLWSFRPQPSRTLIDLAAQPFYKQWRYDYEPDKYWAGNPIQTNIQFFPFVKPFGKQWEYNLITDTWWQGTPTSNTMPAQFAQPFFKQWRYDLEPDKYWLGTPQPADTLSALVSGGAPFFKQWRYDLEWDKVWQGSPIQTNIQFFPFVVPFHRQWEYHFEPDKYWQGQPLQATGTINLPITLPFSNEWAPQYTLDSDVRLWQRYSWSAISLELLVEGGAPFYKQWRYDFEPDKFWQGAPVRSQALFTPLPTPLNKQLWRYDFEPDKYWQWGSQASDNLFMLVEGGPPFFKLWRYDYDVEYPTKWQGTPMGNQGTSILSPVSPRHNEWIKPYLYDVEFPNKWQGAPLSATPTIFLPPTSPFFKLWRWDYATTEYWGFTSQPADTLWIHVMGGTPTHRQWRYDFEPDKYWQGAPVPTNILFFPFVVPFSNEWFQQYWYDSGATYWQGTPSNQQAGRIPVLGPFSNEWFQQTTWDSSATYWQGRPIQSSMQALPAAVPFSNEWSAGYIDTANMFWQGKPTGPFAPMIALPPPFFKSWASTSTYDSGATYWQGTPLSVNPRTFPFVVPFATEWWSWTWDSGATYWQGRPINLLASGERIPIFPPHNVWASLYTQDSDLHLWRFSDYVRQNAVATFKFRVFPFSGAYLKETIDVPPFWVGHATSLPPFLINVAIAVFNPEDMIPGRPLHPRRKDPLVWTGDDWRKLAIPDDALWPRRKDPIRGRNR